MTSTCHVCGLESVITCLHRQAHCAGENMMIMEMHNIEVILSFVNLLFLDSLVFCTTKNKNTAALLQTEEQFVSHEATGSPTWSAHQHMMLNMVSEVINQPFVVLNLFLLVSRLVDLCRAAR